MCNSSQQPLPESRLLQLQDRTLAGKARYGNCSIQRQGLDETIEDACLAQPRQLNDCCACRLTPRLTPGWQMLLLLCCLEDKSTTYMHLNDERGLC
jgi:hypothetical protein